MLTVTLLRGLPASGKTTWAKEQVAAAPANSIKRLNKDDMRNMLDNGRYSKGSEKLVLALRDTMIGLALAQGSHVIVDDTNLAPKHERDIKRLVKEFADTNGNEYRVIVKDFDLPMEDCIIRDYNRPNGVGEKVIRDMYNRFLKVDDKQPAYREHTKPEACIICDIDGTLARRDTRGAFDFDRVSEDGCHAHIADMLSRYGGDELIILVSGRDDSCESETRQWLNDHDIDYDLLFMRKTGDHRCDTVIKREMYDTFIEPHYDVLFVLDDRDRVVDMWRKDLNIPCLQVYYGDF